MPGDPRLRVSDAERDKTIEVLREHHAVGRLSAQEYEERMHSVFLAKTRGELDEVLADLPAIDLYRLPSAGIAGSRARGGARIEPRGGSGRLPERIPPAAVRTAAALAVFGAALAMGAVFNSWIATVVVILLVVAVVAARRRPHLPARTKACAGRVL
jgi:uncharacterized membrane protein